MPNKNFDAAKLKHYYNALKVERGIDFGVATESEKYIPELHGGTQAVDRLKQAIYLQDDQGVFLFTGQRGSGKSTELLRLKHELEINPEEPCRVYYLDMEQWLSTSRELDLGAFMVAIVAAWIAQAYPNNTNNTWHDRLKRILSKINIEGIGINSLINIQFALRSDDSFLGQLSEAVKKNRSAFVPELHQFVQAISTDLRQSSGREKCVLLIASLEKLTGVASKATQVYESVLNLFALQSEALKLPLVHVVYSIAPYVLNQNRQLPALLGGAVAVQLPSVHIFNRNSGDPDQNGIGKIINLLTKRCPEWKDFFDEADVSAFAKDSGGDLRDFLRGLQVCLTGLSPKHPRADQNDWNEARSQIKPNTAIDLQHAQWMARVDTTHSAELDGPITALVLERYLSTKHVLAYLNGDTWYGLHPLIRTEIAEYAKTHANHPATSA